MGAHRPQGGMIVKTEICLIFCNQGKNGFSFTITLLGFARILPGEV
jgi:hypothetical protein